jgi:hypothetical protein
MEAEKKKKSSTSKIARWKPFLGSPFEGDEALKKREARARARTLETTTVPRETAEAARGDIFFEFRRMNKDETKQGEELKKK